ncbi:hypothetical protein EIN_130630, partial [Entamoeba invadens IP1]
MMVQVSGNKLKRKKTDQKFSFKVDRYSEVHGITDETTPYEIFSLFFTKELKDFVILQSNNYGKVATKNKKGKQVFKEITKMELDAFLSVSISQANYQDTKCPLSSLWKLLASTPMNTGPISVERYSEIKWALRFDTEAASRVNQIYSEEVQDEEIEEDQIQCVNDDTYDPLDQVIEVSRKRMTPLISDDHRPIPTFDQIVGEMDETQPKSSVFTHIIQDTQDINQKIIVTTQQNIFTQPHSQFIGT